MSVRLAFGVTTGPGVRCWLPTSGGGAMPVDDRAGSYPPGAPVVVGPDEAGSEAVRDAVEQLTLLVADGTEAAAGAGVDFGAGFRSARLAGAAGDRRDAVLAALRSLGADGAHRLGDRAGVLVALFGLSATKRVGAAANTAIGEQRWAALQLASAVSDLVGPEQLERLLELRAPDGVDPFPRGAASTLSDHLSRVLTRYQRPRRLALIVSLWHHVCGQLLDRQRLADLAATQLPADHVDRLRERHREHFTEAILRQLPWSVGDPPALAAAARWRPPLWWTAHELRRLLHDAIAATALLRFARTMSDAGLAVAARKHRDELAAADACLTRKERSAAARRGEGVHGHPARPGCYVHDLLQEPRPGRAITRKIETYVRERVAVARDYGVVVLDAVTELVADADEQPLRNCWDACKPWQVVQLREWRAAAGFRRAPTGWEQPPLADTHADGPKETLARRVAAAPATDPAVLETPHDLLWYADLADALAPFHGNETAVVRHERPMPDVDHNPSRPHEPYRPRAESVPLAAAGVAQLVAFGATPPPGCGSWPELADRVVADAAVAEASVEAFPVPPVLSVVDGQVVPGTTLVVELGRGPRQLAAWSSYMGNCIGQSWYAEQAHRGQCVLMALRDGSDGRIAANLDIRRRGAGWQVHELLARFNDTLDQELEQHVRRWVGTLPPLEPPVPEPALPVPPERPRGGASRRSAAGRLPTELIRALTAAVARELATAPAAAARRTYAVLARGLGRPAPADFEPDAAVVALKRLPPGQHVELLRTALDAGLGAATLWRATRVRPLATAIASLDPGLREYDRIATLTDGAPLPRTLRALVRRPEIAPAHAMDVAARAARGAMGELLGDAALHRSVARRPAPELVCALVVATTCMSTVDDTVRLLPAGTTAVPGFPATDLLDEQGPWQQAIPAAADLGAPAELFDERIAEHGLLAPAALLGRGGWPALWHRAHR